MIPLSCPLCCATDAYGLPVAGKLYHRCRACELVWLDAAEHLDPEREKAVYDGHDNQVDDPRYRSFLMRAFGEVLSRLPPPASGLDFGCGPGPALIAMGREAGYQMAGYDKFYTDLPELLTRQYDFITSTEVIEHIAAPRAVLDGLWACLKPGGILVLQTQRVLGDERFKSWRYRHDPTHIVFFAEASFRALAARWQADVLFPHADVAVITKP
ncbi:class I SAM-dependent methyltransferase [Aeromonas bestiarum]|uniref:class I SAM-dependent methyltransferase n=1 Tax=Aeromonas bestiarum TaxID=105751 RepID=UPI002377ED74|nr:class I SAM-dependent methyltransferase [Aeromonas bestiarum]WDL83632.1 class I SAM-dependent methyltransferase [Aeromonas bestiarum]